MCNSEGNVTNENIEFRQFNETVDSVGPQVSGYLSANGQNVTPNDQLQQTLQYVVVDFDKSMDATVGASMDTGSVYNLNNWVLEQSDGAPLAGGIATVYYGMNESQTLEQSGRPGQRDRDQRLEPGGDQPVASGAGAQRQRPNRRHGRRWAPASGRWLSKTACTTMPATRWAAPGSRSTARRQTISFNISIPSGGETPINGNPLDPIDGHPGNPTTLAASSGNTVASDGNGDFVAVFTDSSAATPGVYAKLYQDDLYPQRDRDPRRQPPEHGRRTGRQQHDQRHSSDRQYHGHAGVVAESADGDFVVTWSQNDGVSGGGWNICANPTRRRACRSPTPIEVNSGYTTGMQNSPAVAMDAAGDFVVTWQSNLQDGSSYGIYCAALRFPGQSAGRHQRAPGADLHRPAGGHLPVAVAGRRPVPAYVTTPPINYTGSTSSAAAKIQADVGRRFHDANDNPLDVNVMATSLTQIVIEFIGNQSDQYEPLLNVVNVSLGRPRRGPISARRSRSKGRRASSGSTTPRPTTRSSPLSPWTPAASSSSLGPATARAATDSTSRASTPRSSPRSRRWRTPRPPWAA